MRKLSSKWLMLVASAGLFVGSAMSYVSHAGEKIYVDSDVSVSAALERYIATNGNIDDISLTSTEEADVTQTPTQPLNEASPEAEVINADSADEASEEDSEEPTTTEEATTTEETTTEEEKPASNPYAIDYNAYADKAVVTASSVNIRKEGNTDSAKVGIIEQGGTLNVMTKGDEWSYVASGNVVGYICNDYIVFGNAAAEYAYANLPKVAEIATTSLRVRASASTTSDCLTIVPMGEKYHILEEGSEWTKIEVDNSVSGYVSNDYIKFVPKTIYAKPVEDTTTSNNNNTNNNTSNNSTTEAPAPQAPTDVPTSEVGQQIANYAVQFVGNPYVYGGVSLTNGADCSGYTLSIFAQFGVSLPHSATAQSKYGKEVSLSALAPGDLVFYDHCTGSIEHVGIYIGNGQVVHASSPRVGIIISNLNYSPPFKAVRIFY